MYMTSALMASVRMLFTPDRLSVSGDAVADTAWPPPLPYRLTRDLAQDVLIARSRCQRPVLRCYPHRSGTR